MKTDSAIQQIRKVRHDISAKCRHDPRALVAYYQAKEASHRDRLVKESAATYHTK